MNEPRGSMNYYGRYCGDYARDTGHLTLAQHGAYTILLDTYYSTEKPLPASINALFRICRAMTDDERQAVVAVADEYFPVSSDGLRHNKRADAEIPSAQKRIEAARSNGKRGGSPLKKLGYNEPGTLYGIQRADGGPVKVGISKHISQRVAQLRSQYGDVVVVFKHNVDDMGTVEGAVHDHFSAWLDGEWINRPVVEIDDVVQAIVLRAQRAGQRAGQRGNSPTPTPTEVSSTTNVVDRTRFARPTVEQVSDYISELGANVDPAAWMDHYTSNGWKVGKNPMKDWRACVRTWARSKPNASNNRPNGNSGSDRSAAGRVRAAVERSRAERATAGAGGDGVAIDGLAVRSPLG